MSIVKFSDIEKSQFHRFTFGASYIYGWSQEFSILENKALVNLILGIFEGREKR